MFLRSTNRRKDGKDHRYFSIVENHRLPGGKSVQRTVLYLGEINDQQQAAWRKTLEVRDRYIERARTSVGETAFEAARTEGRAMSSLEAIAFARQPLPGG
jgi:hypothetical protein